MVGQIDSSGISPPKQLDVVVVQTIANGLNLSTNHNNALYANSHYFHIGDLLIFAFVIFYLFSGSITSIQPVSNVFGFVR